LDPDRYGDESDYPDDVIRIPFAASWLAPAVGTNAQVYTAQSDETNLVNIFDHEATITELNGKLMGVPEMTDVSVDVGAGMLVRMVSGNSAPLIRDFIEWREAFDRQTRAWTAGPPAGDGYKLKPGEYVIAALTGAKALTNAGGSFQPMV